MANRSQVHRFIDVEAQVDDETETSEEDNGCGKSYCNVINIFTLTYLVQRTLSMQTMKTGVLHCHPELLRLFPCSPRDLPHLSVPSAR